VAYRNHPDVSTLQDWELPVTRDRVERQVAETWLDLEAQGDVLVFSGILEQLDQRPAPARPNRLTAREHEVLELLREGLPDKQIATRLQISVKTVEKHVGSVLRKNGVHSRTELLVQA
jgi:DNA-binding NarL/FixJ family response regulator